MKKEPEMQHITCTKAEYDKMKSHPAACLYFCYDTQQIFKGDTEFSGGGGSGSSKAYTIVGSEDSMYLNSFESKDIILEDSEIGSGFELVMFVGSEENPGLLIFSDEVESLEFKVDGNVIPKDTYTVSHGITPSEFLTLLEQPYGGSMGSHDKYRMLCEYSRRNMLKHSTLVHFLTFPVTGERFTISGTFHNVCTAFAYSGKTRVLPGIFEEAQNDIFIDDIVSNADNLQVYFANESYDDSSSSGLVADIIEDGKSVYTFTDMWKYEGRSELGVLNEDGMTILDPSDYQISANAEYSSAYDVELLTSQSPGSILITDYAWGEYLTPAINRPQLRNIGVAFGSGEALKDAYNIPGDSSIEPTYNLFVSADCRRTLIDSTEYQIKMTGKTH
jgi:hypothetical protein